MLRKFSIIYKILTAFSLFTGITFYFYKVNTPIPLLSYYTFLSNVCCLIAFVCYSIIEIKDKNRNYQNSDIYNLIKGSIVIMIFLTFLGYYTALLPFGFNMESLQKNLFTRKMSNLFVHTCSPCLVILDYFFFDEKGKFKKYYPFLWLFFPFNYVVYVYIYSFQGGTFPKVGGSERFAYFFLDYTKVGVLGVIKWIIGISLLILLVSYILVFIDKKLKRKRLK